MLDVMLPDIDGFTVCDASSSGWTRVRCRSARDHVFERFYRAHSGAGSPAGSGLGLALCREVATAHGGRVWVERTPGGGSSFSLALLATRR